MTPKYITQFEVSAMLLIEMFAHKHEVDFEYCSNDDVTGIICFADNYFNLSDVYFDLKENKPKGLIFEWQDYLTEHNITNNTNDLINFNSYCMGSRFENKKDI